MFRLLPSPLLVLVLFAAPLFAAWQDATPIPVCPNGEYPMAGALRASDGVVQWTLCSPDAAYRYVIGANDDIVLIQESVPDDGTVPALQRTVALSATDGSEMWNRTTLRSPLPSGPYDSQGVVILLVDNAGAPALVGVDARTGDEQWHLDASEVPLAHGTSVVVVADVIQIGASSQFHGIDRASGEEVWVSDIPLLDQSGIVIARSPAAVLGDVLVVPTGPTVSAIDMRTGVSLWQAPRLDHLAATDGAIIGVQGANGPSPSIIALDATSGEQLWTQPGRPSYGGFLAAGDGVVIVLDSNMGLVAYELPTGQERWRSAPEPFVEPQLVHGTSLVALWEGELSVMSTTGGSTTWSVTLPFGSPWMNSVGANDNMIFVAINSLPWGD